MSSPTQAHAAPARDHARTNLDADAATRLDPEAATRLDPEAVRRPDPDAAAPLSSDASAGFAANSQPRFQTDPRFSTAERDAATAKMPSVMPASQISCRLLCRLGIIISLKLPHHLERDVGIRAASSCRTSFHVVLL